MRMESDLRKAFERGEFCLFYQPIISLENRHTVSLEALLRWQHPEKGLISPDQFIPLAEDTGLIRELGLWVFEQACYQLKYWQVLFPHHHNLGVNINVSAIQLKQPRLVREVESIIQRSGLKPEACRMEITESAMMNDPDLMLNVLKDLKGLEVQLYIDDFGTGYSSLSYLQKFPIDALKIDKSFIQNIGASDKSMQIAQAIIALGNAFDLRVVAEGVETVTQLNILQASHCHHVQGYYFSRPIDKENAENYLSILVH
jgi:EAL domain-containing protein (putative c-di-GMP-specific phosphodiesterase class I)